MSEIKSLYLHGLGRAELRRGERVLLAHHRRSGIDAIPGQIDWASPEKFVDLLDRTTYHALSILDGMSPEGTLIIEGSSAGGSLAFNVAHQIEDERLRVISHSGRLAVGDYEEGSYRSLEHCARLGTDEESQSYFDSVTYLELITKPKMDQNDMDRSFITMPLGDMRVPTSTMSINGIKTAIMPIVGHSPGIGLGMLWTPKIIEKDFGNLG
ncbi:hypothetical protein H6800_01555 [Candidatus Nomurabacteria bacterium]|nr:hypothetical protein [Candidatus Nomurabacteria bacterium]